MTITPTVIPLPPRELRFMNENDAGVVEVGSALAEQLYRLGLSRDGLVLDVGFGYGRLAIGLMHTGFQGTYCGFEVLKKQANWCIKNLAPLFDGRYRFRHLDIYNGRYNPNGTVQPSQVRFPARPQSQDMVALFSVFTHMYVDDIRIYLREIQRVLRPGRGLAATTWFVWDESMQEAIRAPERNHPMVHVLDPVTRYADATDPLRAICHREDVVRRLIAEAGLELHTFERGTWATVSNGFGERPQAFQDLLLLRRPPLTLRRRVTRLAGRALRRLGLSRRTPRGAVT